MRTKTIGWVTAAVLLAAAIMFLRGMLGGPDPPPAVDVGVEESLANGDVARTRLSLGYQVRPALIPTSGGFSSDPIAWEAPAALWTAVGFEEASRYQRAPRAFRVSAKGPGGEAVLVEVDASEELAAGTWHPVRAEIPADVGSPMRLHFSIDRDTAVGSARAESRAVWAAPRLLRVGGDPPPNVLLIVLDTLRADRTSAYGYARSTTPFLEKLASRGATVSEMISPYPTTLPSHWTMFSGLNTLHHGTYRPGLEDWPSEMVPLAERLQRAGYLTAAFTEGGYVHAGFGLSQGFDIYDNGPFAREIDARDSANATFATAAGWIEDNRDASFFVFLQTYEVHTPYTPPPDVLALFETGYTGRYPTDYPARTASLVNTGKVELSAEELEHVGTLYDAEIRALDRTLEAFWSRLEAAGVLEDTLVVITSDHGEDMMEHGWLHHGTTLYDPALHVPFVALWPGRIPAGAWLDCQRGLVDLTPTVLDLLGLEAAEGVDGASFASALRRGRCDSDVPVAFELRNATWSRTRDLPAAGLRDGGWKYIARLTTGRDELYDLERDPGEEENLVATEDERVAAMRGRLLALLAGATSRSKPPELEGEMADRLRSLGYIE